MKINFLNVRRFTDFGDKKSTVSREITIQFLVKKVAVFSRGILHRCYYFFHCFQYYGVILIPLRCVTAQKNLPLRISSVSETKSVGKCGLGYIY